MTVSTPGTTTTLRRKGYTLPTLFTLTIFLSASLLFFVQPLFAKLTLPVIGGAPAVWTTAMLFFQTVLIGGYLYAHLLVRFCSIRWQLGIHLAFWCLGVFFLPLAIPENWVFDAEGTVVLQTLWLFAIGVGIPFAVLSANAPLIQAWYRSSGAPSGDDPYFLYGASNLGSIIALLAFPLIAEPFFGASSIGQGWTYGFISFGICLALISVVFFSRSETQQHSSIKTDVQAAISPGITIEQIATWLMLAFVPSSLMLAVTTKISTDMGTIPMVWILPLTLFLATFPLTFRQQTFVPDTWLKTHFSLSTFFLIYVFSTNALAHGSITLAAALLLAFFSVALFAHRQLYLARPDGSQLTVFYLVMSIGGALGGLYNSIIAPIIFDALREGPATVAMAAIIPVFLVQPELSKTRTRIILSIAALMSIAAIALATFTGSKVYLLLPASMALLAALLIANRMITFVVALITVTVSGAFLEYSGAKFADRSFFGAHMVRDIPDGRGLRSYVNGTTVHGLQRISDLNSARPMPLGYYHPELPMAQVLQSELARSATDIGIIGLGIGSLACYRKPEQTYHFYEIDNLVDQIARNSGLFTYMSACAENQPTYLGDARVVIKTQNDLKMSILVVDAYSSDAVPVHLTTTEAMQLYFERVENDGVVLYHISNRFYDIHIPLVRSASALGLNIWIHDTPLTEQQDRDGAFRSIVVMVARQEAQVHEILRDQNWQALTSDGGRVWTDDYANPLSILRILR